MSLKERIDKWSRNSKTDTQKFPNRTECADWKHTPCSWRFWSWRFCSKADSGEAIELQAYLWRNLQAPRQSQINYKRKELNWPQNSSQPSKKKNGVMSTKFWKCHVRLLYPVKMSFKCKGNRHLQMVSWNIL